MPSSRASLDQSPRKNWVENSGGLPPSVRARARALKKKNPTWTLAHCLAVAISQYKKEGATGHPKGAKVSAEWSALKARNKARMAGKKTAKFARKLGWDPGEMDFEVVDLGLLRKSAGKASYGQAGAGFDESKHPRTPQNGMFAGKVDPSQLIAARRVVEGRIAGLQVGDTFDIPGKLGWVKRTESGYFVQGPAGYTASVRTLSSAVQAAAIILAGKFEPPR